MSGLDTSRDRFNILLASRSVLAKEVARALSTFFREDWRMLLDVIRDANEADLTCSKLLIQAFASAQRWSSFGMATVELDEERIMAKIQILSATAIDRMGADWLEEAEPAEALAWLLTGFCDGATVDINENGDITSEMLAIMDGGRAFLILSGRNFPELDKAKKDLMEAIYDVSPKNVRDKKTLPPEM